LTAINDLLGIYSDQSRHLCTLSYRQSDNVGVESLEVYHIPSNNYA